MYAPLPGNECCTSAAQCDDGDPCTIDTCGVDAKCAHSQGPPIPGAEEICGDGIDNDCDPDTVCYYVKQGALTIPLEPIKGSNGVVTYYGYNAPGNGSSADTDHEISNSAALFLYEDADGNISLLFILDEVQDGSGGACTIQWSGAMGMEVLVYDDNLGGNDTWVVDLEAGTGYAEWYWGACCTDGLALGYLAGDFCVDFTVSKFQGLQNITVWDTPNHTVALPQSSSFSVCSGQ